jgi:hypothetical protein
VSYGKIVLNSCIKKIVFRDALEFLTPPDGGRGVKKEEDGKNQNI